MHNSPQSIRGHSAPPYRHVAWCYDALASLYSIGAIDRAKATHTQWLNAGDRVLYVGAGSGREIVRACESGAAVTCVEPCTAMAKRLSRRTAPWSDRITIENRPVQSVRADPRYDLVACHFFLNVFPPGAMPAMLDHVCRFVKPGGRLVVADFRANDADASRLRRAGLACYYLPLNGAGWLLRIGAWHAVYDYGPLVMQRGFAIERRTDFSVLPGWPPWYQVTVARRG